MKKITAVLLSILLLFGCKKSNDKSTCENPVCTKELRYVSILIKDGRGNPYALDSFSSILVSEDLVLTGNSNFEDAGLTSMRGRGEYVIATDYNNIIKLIPTSGSNVRFLGYKTGTKVADKVFKVGHDCCHVKMVSADTTIIVP